MRINAVSQSIQAEVRKTEQAKKTEKNQSTGRSVSPDRSQISDKAMRLSDTKSSINTITTSLLSQTDIRTDKISEVQEKIKNGYYNSPEFIDKLADKLLSEFGIKPTS